MSFVVELLFLTTSTPRRKTCPHPPDFRWQHCAAAKRRSFVTIWKDAKTFAFIRVYSRRTFICVHSRPPFIGVHLLMARRNATNRDMVQCGLQRDVAGTFVQPDCTRITACSEARSARGKAKPRRCPMESGRGFTTSGYLGREERCRRLSGLDLANSAEV